MPEYLRDKHMLLDLIPNITEHIIFITNIVNNKILGSNFEYLLHNIQNQISNIIQENKTSSDNKNQAKLFISISCPSPLLGTP